MKSVILSAGSAYVWVNAVWTSRHWCHWLSWV